MDPDGLAIVDLLLSLGADPNQRDCSFDSTPLGWAEHGRHQQIIDCLTPVTEPGPDKGPGSEGTLRSVGAGSADRSQHH